MGEVAIKSLAEVTNYHSTGTVEFLYQDGEFFLLRNEYDCKWYTELQRWYVE